MDYEEIKKAASEDRLYDYVANHYWQMDGETLKDLCLVALGVAYDLAERYGDGKLMPELLASEIENRMGE